MQKTVTLYMTLGCHLCDEAYRLMIQTVQVEKLALKVEQVDIVNDDEVYNCYFDKIPVIQRLDGETLVYPFDSKILADWLKSA